MSTPVASLADDIAAARAAGDPQRLLGALPYARLLGAEARLVEGQLRLLLPAAPHNVGNPHLPALHGGALAAFAELAAIVTLLWQQAAFVLPKTVTTTVDFARSAGLKPTEAQGRVGRLGRRIATVEVDLWQDSADRPVASAHTHFLLS
jgi:uncharacterized protein (TIGR00369 family)